jgi:flagellar biosynthetic protein FliQ
MEPSQLIAVGREALVLVILASAPPLFAALLAGAVASVLQAVTSIQESTLSVVPKLGAAAIALALAGPWIGAQMARFATEVLRLLPAITG